MRSCGPQQQPPTLSREGRLDGRAGRRRWRRTLQVTHSITGGTWLFPFCPLWFLNPVAAGRPCWPRVTDSGVSLQSQVWSHQHVWATKHLPICRTDEFKSCRASLKHLVELSEWNVGIGVQFKILFPFHERFLWNVLCFPVISSSVCPFYRKFNKIKQKLTKIYLQFEGRGWESVVCLVWKPPGVTVVTAGLLDLDVSSVLFSSDTSALCSCIWLLNGKPAACSGPEAASKRSFSGWNVFKCLFVKTLIFSDRKQKIYQRSCSQTASYRSKFFIFRTFDLVVHKSTGCWDVYSTKSNEDRRDCCRLSSNKKIEIKQNLISVD